MYQIYEYTSNTSEGPKREVVLLAYPNDCDIEFVLHEVGLNCCLSADGSTLKQSELSYAQLMDMLTPELLEPYGVIIVRPLNEATQLDEKGCVLSRCELKSVQQARKREHSRMHQMKTVAGRYARRLALKQAKHPVISTWNPYAISVSAVEWALEFIDSGMTNSGNFFKMKLAKADPVVSGYEHPETGDSGKSAA